MRRPTPKQPSSPAVHAVLVPLDGSIAALAAIPVARTLATLYGSTLHVVHVGDPVASPRKLLQTLAVSRGELRDSVIHQTAGDPSENIVRLALERQSTIIVMCASTRGNHLRGHLGSVARDVLTEAVGPVVLVPPSREPAPWQPGRLLVPHDGTPTTAGALGPAFDLARRAEAEVLVLHVSAPEDEPPSEIGSLGVPMYLDQPHHEWSAWSSEFLDRLSSLADGPPLKRLRLLTEGGAAGEAILRCAAEYGVDLIVLAWRGRLEPGRAQTLNTVVHGSTCPTLVLRIS